MKLLSGLAGDSVMHDIGYWKASLRMAIAESLNLGVFGRYCELNKTLILIIMNLFFNLSQAF